jgi:hypothetical protein
MSKAEEVRSLMERKVNAALAELIVTMSDREASEVIRRNMGTIGRVVGYEVCTEYSFLELADIMEWKRTRVRR